VQTGSNPRSLAGTGAAQQQQGSVIADDGPIIFYRNAAFYTDLSGSRHGAARPARPSAAYERLEARPLGSDASSAARLEALRRREYEKGPLSRAEDPPPRRGSGSASPPSAGEPLEVIAAGEGGGDGGGSESTDGGSSPIDFEVSGVGGVLPADNFAISVRSRQIRGQAAATAAAAAAAAAAAGPSARPASSGRSKSYPTRIRDALHRGAAARGSAAAARAQAGAPPVVDRLIIGSKRRELPASKLPEAVFFYASSEDDDDDDDDDDGSEDADESGSEGASSEGDVPPDPRRAAWLAAKYRGPRSRRGEEDEVEEDGDEKEARPAPARKGRLPAASPSPSDEDEDEDDDEESSSSDSDARARATKPAVRRPKALSLKRARPSNESVLVHMSRRPKLEMG
jgi:hypothetical protein